MATLIKLVTTMEITPKHVRILIQSITVGLILFSGVVAAIW